MQTIWVWVLFQVFPFVYPVALADTAITCVALARKFEERVTLAEKKETEDILLKCTRIEILVEGI